MLKRMIAFALVFALAIPMGFAGLGGEAVAATALNGLPKEPKFTSATTVARPTTSDGVTEFVLGTKEVIIGYELDGVTPIMGPEDVIGTKYTTALSFMEPAVSGSYAAWAYAAAALLKQKGSGTDFDIAKMNPGVNGNRSTLSAYLMDVAKNSPVNLYTPSDRTPVTGVVYLPNPTGRGDMDFIYNLQHAVLNGKAAAASLYYSENSYYTDTDRGEDLYHNTSSSSDNHTVVIVGWDDGKTGTYTRVPASGDPTTFELTKPGAFLVHDDNHTLYYWVSYETLLSSAYYIEGFYDNNNGGDFEATTPRTYTDASKNPKNPLAYTYQYDLGGLNSISTTTAAKIAYANVFEAKDGALALHAVSVFLTGENNEVDIHLVDNYIDETSLIYNPGNKIASVSGVTDRKPLPGYYTIPLDSAVKLHNKRFAIIAVVTYNPITGSGIPTSSSSSTNSFIIRDATVSSPVWTKSSAAVCLKAHAELDVDIPLTDVSIPTTNDEDGNPIVANTVLVAPGGSRSLGPDLTPANANDILPAKNRWTLTPPAAPPINPNTAFHYERDADGWLIADENPLEEGKWIADPPEAVPAAGLVWNDSLKLFVDPALADKKVPTNGSSSWAANKTKQGKVVSNYKAQPLKIINAGSAGAKIEASGDKDYYDNMYQIKLTASRGKKDANGIFEKSTGPNPDYLPPVLGPSEISSAARTVKIDAGTPEIVKLSKEFHTMKANGTVTLTAKAFDNEDKVLTRTDIKWYVLGEGTGIWPGLDTNGKPNAGVLEYNPLDPYSDSGPVARVDEKGKVTAIQHGVCYVYAVVGGVPSAPCEVTVTETAATGISVSKKKITLSTGTMFTLNATVKPAAASNKRVTWTVSGEKDRNGDPADGQIIADVGLTTGIITIGSKAGTATVTAACAGYTADCVITVTEAPTVSMKKGKSGTFAVTGAGSKDEIHWVWEDLTSFDDPDDPVKAEKVFSEAKFVTVKQKVTAQNVGSGILTAKVILPGYDADGTENADGPGVVVRAQSWKVVSVIPISKMAFTDKVKPTLDTTVAKNGIIKKLTLCVDANGSNGQSETLGVQVLKPLSPEGTLLDFEWTVKKDKSGEEGVSIVEDPLNNGKITITALKPGTAKITGVNHNSKKKITITVKVLLYPSESDIKLSKASASGTLEVVVGKTANAKAKVTGKNMEKALIYTLAPGDDAVVTLVKDKKGNATGKLVTKKTGTATLTIEAVGSNGKKDGTGNGAKITVTVNVIEKPSRK